MSLFSYSRIRTYEICPLKYRLAYVDNITDVPEETLPSYMDARVKEALERLYRWEQSGRSMKWADLKNFYRSQWRTLWKDTWVLKKPGKDPAAYRRKGEEYLSAYFRRYTPFREGSVAALEVTDFLPLEEEKGYDYYIRIERLMLEKQGDYSVHSYRTAADLPDQEELDKDIRMGMYAYWVTREYPDCRNIRLVWHFLPHNRSGESTRTQDQLEILRRDVLDQIEKIAAADDFPPRISALCDWCRFYERCPVFLRPA